MYRTACCLSPICAALECDVSRSICSPAFLRIYIYIYIHIYTPIYTYIHIYIGGIYTHRLGRLLLESNLRGVRV